MCTANELEKKGLIEDKKRQYEEAKITSLRVQKKLEKLEKLLAVERSHAKKMAERQNKALAELRLATA